MKVLGIETSCDETGVALFDTEQGLLAEALYSQVDLHAEYGGVVPELASRDHIRKTLPLIDKIMKEAAVVSTDIDGIAYTAGPGLMGALLVGASLAKSLSFAWQVPALAVHHMEGHLLAPMLSTQPPFPYVALLVSGGHTMLAAVQAIGQYQLLGETLDDAAGEAFDKTAKILKLGYPGGAKLSALAAQGEPSAQPYPRPMTDRPGLDFSFSGLKTYTLNKVQAATDLHAEQANIAASFQEAVVETLVIKCRRALQQTGYKTLVVAGGVSANALLRQRLSARAVQLNAKVFYPELPYCTDNGAMIAYAGAQRLAAGQQDETLAIEVRPRWPMTELKNLSE